MSHAAQRAFFASVKERFPAAFAGVRALDCGSFDVNGSLKTLFVDSEYIGVDMRAGRNVNVVSKVHDLGFAFAPGSFQTVVSAEMLEHDEHWRESLLTMLRLLLPGGLLALSMAGTGRPEHGTASVPDDGEVWGTTPDYYRPLDAADLRSVFNVELAFGDWAITENAVAHDLYFWGVKR